jgi:hypothetical protein
MPEYALRAAAAARPTTRRFQSIPRDPHAMEAGTARLRGRPHRMLRTRVVLDCAAAWTRLDVRVTRGRRPRRRRREWLTCTAGGTQDSTIIGGEAGEYALRVGGRGALRIIQCVPRAFRNGAHLQTFLTGQSLQGQPPLECSVCSHESPMCMRGPMRVSVCGHVCARARA